MKQLTILLTGTLLLGSSFIYASPKFSVVPTANSITAMLLPLNFTETLSYQVTNNTNILRTLTMKPINGVSQNVGGANVCSNPFTLAPHQSCNLSLTINASQIRASGIQGGPIICKTTGPNNN